MNQGFFLVQNLGLLFSMFTLGSHSPKSLRTEVLSGLTVALALVPEAVAFAFVAGVEPLVGLYAAFMVGLLAAIFGGRPGMISGATGAMAVVVGVIVSALVFAWEHAKHIRVEKYDREGSRVYELHGPLFFGSVQNFLDLFHPENDPDDVVIEFQHSRVADHSAIEAIDTLAERYIKAGKTLHLRHLSPECRKLLKKAGDLVEVNVMEDPHYHIATDEMA
ncbi:MAG: hypothetical protein AXA67_09610 [Methylothermaceae bacteria B42]|nr:MAG: hypothetical protein AXA67_09610 [Methylothermaceae bacteria B42]HHJ39560.1 STAS domain-containing protein [Methylothermaceae bacterium]